MVNHPNRISAARHAEIIAKARASEDDRYINNLRIIPADGYLVTFEIGAEPKVEHDRFGAGPAMEAAAAAVPYDAYRDMAIDRIAARHRALRGASD